MSHPPIVSHEEWRAARTALLAKEKALTRQRDAIMAEVVVDVGGQEVVAAITRHSAERLSLKQGDPVTVIIKSTEVMIGK